MKDEMSIGQAKWEILPTSKPTLMDFAQLQVGDGIPPGLIACNSVLAAVCILGNLPEVCLSTTT